MIELLILINKIISTEYGLIFIRFLSLGLNFIFNTIIAKIFGASDVGIFYFTFSLVTFLSILTRLGTDSYVIREVSKDKHAAVFSISIINYLILSLVLFLLLRIVTECFNVNNIEYLNAFFAFIFFNNVLILLGQYCNAFGNFKTGLLVTTMFPQLLTLVVLLICLEYYSVNLLLLIDSYVLSVSFSSIVLFFINKNNINLSLNIKSGWDTLSHCLDFYKSSVIYGISAFIPVFALGILSDTSQVSWYNLSLRISASCAVIFVAMNSFYSPQISRAFSDRGFEAVLPIYKKVIYRLNVLMQPMLIVALVLGYFLFRYLGDSFQGALVPLLILLFYQSINAFLGFSGTVLNMCGYEEEQKKSIYLSFFVMVVFIVPSTYILGSIGAALAYLTANTCGNLRTFYFLKRKLNETIINLQYPS